MTLYSFPDPRADLRATIAANAARWPAGTTYSDKVATAVGAAPHIQYAWDGTPSGEQQRDFTAVRITVWGWKEQVAPNTFTTTDGASLAQLVRSVFLEAGSVDVWRYTRGLGVSVGKDPDSGVPFSTFTLTAETRPSPVA